ncbi:MAG: hypothetical protein E6Q88_08885 [Lysobacteraceae bacterium]|nr:MAG: hypothetical protein E6Q88_08885 [Xanthomonadaceae bacterium]
MHRDYDNIVDKNRTGDDVVIIGRGVDLGRVRPPFGGILIAMLASMLAMSAACAPRSDRGVAEHRAALARAMSAGDAAAIAREVESLRQALGDRTGLPETPDRYERAPDDVAALGAEEARSAVAPVLARMAAHHDWSTPVDPRTLDLPLRDAAEIVVGALNLRRVDPAQIEPAMALARTAGDFLLHAQSAAGTGGFPFPASRGASDAEAFRASRKFLDAAEREGRLDRVLRNGWIVDDLGDGGLQFDNGECGVAMLALHAATGEAKYLASARAAADWAIRQPLATNWNYNSFSVYLLTEAWVATGDTRYRDAALEKARLGVIPGQLRAGPRAGRWLDPHNARPAYHYIMLRALARLLAALPAHHEAREDIDTALRLGLSARNHDFTDADAGVANKDQAWQALLAAARAYADRPDTRKETGTDAALDSLRRLSAAQWRRGHMPMSPQSFGLLLADAVGPRGIR